ncbi:unnamed protein product [Cunninghamella blakesleeana]
MYTKRFGSRFIYNDTISSVVEHDNIDSASKAYILISDDDDESISGTGAYHKDSSLFLKLNNNHHNKSNNGSLSFVSAALIKGDSNELDSLIDLTLRNKNEVDKLMISSSPSPLTDTPPSPSLLLVSNNRTTSIPNIESNIIENDQLPVVITQQDIILPNYNSLTLSELRNAVKKYGYKTKDRSTMVSILKKIHTSTNQLSSPLTTISKLTSQSENNNSENENSSISYIQNIEFSDHIKKKTGLWERILRYEAVKLDECSDGLDKKKKHDLRIFLDENALIHKPPKQKLQN